MKKHIYSSLFAVTLLAGAPLAASAQINGGYFRETVQRGAAAEADMRISVDAALGTSTGISVRARATSTGQATGRRTATSTPMREGAVNAQVAETARLEKRAEIEARIAAKKLAITNEMFTRIADRIARAAKRLEDAATRLADTATLLRTRSEALEAQDVDMSAVNGILDAADKRIATLRVSLVDLAEDGELAAASTTPAAAWVEAREDFTAVITEVHDIRALLHDVVAAIKEAVRVLGERGVSAAVSADAAGEANGTTTVEATITSE
ncbi:hypothetical protein A3G62_02390 [Candidatus Kaiserbacteria bacterium RIFCSPLOWO2_12_FULL_50_10]|nr:MAG: hypothetical protein A3G62_02390 [Candidatus Kaiserbacteria bacterium RIFCSPLOWO2_12_FULL_50_10]